MAYRIKRKETVGKAIRRIVGGEIEQAVAEASDPDRPREQRVHSVRAHLKRARAALRLVRSGAGKRARRDERWMVQIGRDLARAREATVESKTWKQLRDRLRGEIAPAIAAAMERAEAQAARRAQSATVETSLVRAIDALERGRTRLGRWQIERPRRSLRSGLERAYRQARKNLRDLERVHDVALFHEWRKSVKRLSYQLRLLRAAAPELWQELGKPLLAVGDILGDANDLAVLRARLDREGSARRQGAAATPPELLALVEGQAERLRDRARARATPLLGPAPRVIAARFDKSWAAWRARA